MDIFRKLSGVRSFQESSTAGAVRSIESDQSEESADEEEEQDNDVDNKEALASAPRHQEGQEEPGKGTTDSQPAGVSELQAQAMDSREDFYAFEEEAENASLGSGGSYDSELEGIIASSNDANNGSKILSPESVLTSSVVLGSPPSVMSVAQQGALIRLNQMMTGKVQTLELLLDTSIIDNSSPEEFEQQVAQLAESRGQNVNDASFVSILDALLPLVVEKSDQLKSDDNNFTEPEVGNGKDQVSVDNSQGVQEEKISRPDAFLTFKDASDDNKIDENQTQYPDKSVPEDIDAIDDFGHIEGDIFAEQNVRGVMIDLEAQEESNVDDSEHLNETLSISEQLNAAFVNSEQLDKASVNSEQESGGGDSQTSEEASTAASGESPMIVDSDGSTDQNDFGDTDHATDHASDQEPTEKVQITFDGVIGAGNDASGITQADIQKVLNGGFSDSKQLPEPQFNADHLSSASSVGNSVTAESDGSFAHNGLDDVDHCKDEEQPLKIPVNVKGENGEGKDASQVIQLDRHVDSYPEKLPEIVESGGAAAQIGSEDYVADKELHGKFPIKSDGNTGEGNEFSHGTQQETQPGQTPDPDRVEDGSAATETGGGNEAHAADEELHVAAVASMGDAVNDVPTLTDPAEGATPADSEESSKWSSSTLAPVFAGDSGSGGVAATLPMGPAGPSLPVRPSRLGRPVRPLEPTRPVTQLHNTGTRPVNAPAFSNEVPDGHDETGEKLQAIKVKFLRLTSRLGQSAQHVVVTQVLYRLGLAEQLRGGHSNSRHTAFSFDRAIATAAKEEAAVPEELSFSCTIMLLGKTGVGKSATLNSIFDEQKAVTDAFFASTKKVHIITGHVHGIKVRVIDTPGLLPSLVDQRHNEKVMASVRGFTKKQQPDIVLYLDRLDMQSQEYGDLPLLRTITETFGASVWFNAIVVLTHAASAPLEGPNGLPLNYETFVTQRSHAVQQTIRQAAGDIRLLNPVTLVDNHGACRKNRSGQRVLPNGQVWKPQLLLLCFASKILAEANSLLKLQDNSPGKPFGARSKVPPLPFLLSSLLQSRAQVKLSNEQMGDDDESDDDLTEEAGSDDDEDYDQLPPFRRLAKDEVAELDVGTRRKYFEELAERERLFQKKQWKEEIRRRRELKRRTAEASSDQAQFVDDRQEDDTERSAAIPVPMPDVVLPPSFDSDNPTYRYRYVEAASQWIVRPTLETHGWEHDNGYDGMSVEKIFTVGNDIPASLSGTITKDKKESNVNIECAASLKLGDGRMTLAGLDIQSVAKDTAYTLRSETRFSNHKGNKTTGGLALTILGDTICTGMKIEDRMMVGKWLKLVLSGGAFTGHRDVAYGGSMEATLKDKDYPMSHTLSTLGISMMDWHGDCAVGGNLQSQALFGRTMVIGRANINNRGAGHISIRASSSEQIQMTLIGLLPVLRTLANRFFGSQSQL